MVRQALADAQPPDRKRTERERPVVGPLIPFIDAILEADRKAPRSLRAPAFTPEPAPSKSPSPRPSRHRVNVAFWLPSPHPCLLVSATSAAGSAIRDSIASVAAFVLHHRSQR